MSAAADREVARLRACRLAFERALRDGVTVEEGRRRNAREAWAATDARLKRLRCGTVDTEDGGEQPLAWWQRD